MNLMLTSDIMSEDKRQLNRKNGFVDKIAEFVTDINCLYMPSDPYSSFLLNTISHHHKGHSKKADSQSINGTRSSFSRKKSCHE